MPKKPYPSQMAPEPPKRPKKPTGSIDKDLRQFAKPMPKPIKAGKSPYGAGQENMPKPYPQRKLKPAVKDAMGIMGSTSEQAKQRKEKALLDMRKRGMLRKKQGQ